MTDIEKVARAIVEAMYQEALTDEQWAEVMADGAPLMWGAAAFAAMQPAPQEPVAWMYSMEGREPVFLPEKLRGDVLCGGRGWTETPLYAFPTPPAGGSDAE